MLKVLVSKIIKCVNDSEEISDQDRLDITNMKTKV